MSRLLTLLSGVAIGGALAHFLDPQSGRQRRDQATAKARDAADKAKATAGKAKGPPPARPRAPRPASSRAVTASRTSTT